MQHQFLDLLTILQRFDVRHIVIGGLAAILHGSPVITHDLDIVFDASSENLERLLAALDELDARYMDPAQRIIRPTRERLEGQKLHLLITNKGRLDLLGSVAEGLTYQHLLATSQEWEEDDLRFRVVDLDALIELKEAADRPKDRINLMYLREILDHQNEEG